MKMTDFWLIVWFGAGLHNCWWACPGFSVFSIPPIKVGIWIYGLSIVYKKTLELKMLPELWRMPLWAKQTWIAQHWCIISTLLQWVWCHCSTCRKEAQIIYLIKLCSSKIWMLRLDLHHFITHNNNKNNNDNDKS